MSYKNTVIKMYGVDIKVDNGVYAFESESATGKTFLGRIAKSDENIGYITYLEDAPEDIYISWLSNMYNKKVIVLDRFDRYGTNKLFSVAVSLSKNAIVLIDTKLCDITGLLDSVNISRTEDILTVR